MLILSAFSLTLAPILRQHQESLTEGTDGAQIEQKALAAQYFQHTGEPVPRGWRPHSGNTWRPWKSVARIAEEQAHPSVMVTYIYPLMKTEYHTGFSNSDPVGVAAPL